MMNEEIKTIISEADLRVANTSESVSLMVLRTTGVVTPELRIDIDNLNAGKTTINQIMRLLVF